MGNCAGIDWASEKHDVLIEDPAGRELLAATFRHDEDGVSALCGALACFDVELVAIERPDGLLVDRLLEAGVRVLAHDENGFILEAPVALNSNHLRTAFGGSINAVATLAAYGLLWLELRELSVHVVVAESSIRFLRPVRETIHAICQRPNPEEWAAFRTRFAEKGKAQLTLRVSVVEEGTTAAEFEGVFIARSM